MKLSVKHAILPLALASLFNLQSAEPFRSGSNGSHGPLIVATGATTNLVVPPDGVFHFTTVSIERAATVRFTSNELNTPVHLLATGDFVCEGYVVLDGKGGTTGLGGAGGPGGFSGGFGGSGGSRTSAGDGRGPGGGRWISNHQGGVFAAESGGNTNIYGNALLYPLVGGSGGCGGGGSPGSGGGGGGGAILIASTSRISLFHEDIVHGGIYARGASGIGGGSGGAIRLVAPVVTGDGVLVVNGGSSATGLPDGSRGRIRIDCLDDFAYRTLSFDGSFTRGSEMFVFRPNAPKLAIVEAAGTQISVGNPGPVTVTLPFGAPTNQIVRLQGAGFAANTPIQVTITPDSGPSASFDAVIPPGDSSAVAVPVIIPAGAISYIDAWTK